MAELGKLAIVFFFLKKWIFSQIEHGVILFHPFINHTTEQPPPSSN